MSTPGFNGFEDKETYQPLEGEYTAHPGGNRTLIGWNEKCVLDTMVMDEVAEAAPPASLPARNDMYRVGIYTSTSKGDFD